MSLKEKAKRIIASIFYGIFIFLASHTSVNAETEVRIRDLEGTFLNVLYAAWSLSILYFIWTVILLGFRWMLSFGNQQTLGEVKKKGANIGLAFFFVFGGWVVVNTLIAVIGLKDPEGCFAGEAGSLQIAFHFFFPTACH